MKKWVLSLGVLFILLIGLWNCTGSVGISTQVPSQVVVPSNTHQVQVEQTLIPVETKTDGNVGEVGISREEDSRLSPLQPYTLTVKTSDTTIELKWNGTGSDIIQYYQIYRCSPSDGKWQPLAQIAKVGDNLGEYSFVDTQVKKGETYAYSITAVDIYENESQKTESVLITLPRK
jgi:fibronectin type 3 domain-containing protein